MIILEVTGTKLSLGDLSDTDTNQMWLMQEGTLKLVTKDLMATIEKKKVGASVILKKEPKYMENGKYLFQL